MIKEPRAHERLNVIERAVIEMDTREVLYIIARCLNVLDNRGYEVNLSSLPEPVHCEE